MLAGVSAHAAWTPTYWPWVQLGHGLGGSVHGVHATSGADSKGTAWLRGDDGGLYRSTDCGDHWEPANGGPGVTTGLRGGYESTNDADWKSECTCDPTQASCPNQPQLCETGIVYGGPPSSSQRFGTFPSAVVTGPAPPGSGLAGTITYRAGASATFSTDFGAHFYPLPTQCVGLSTLYGGTTAWAVDAGQGGHMVAANGDGLTDAPLTPPPFEASGCAEPKTLADAIGAKCGMRAIAWTQDAGPQMAVSKAVSDQRHTAAARLLDKASQWHYASLNHLAVSNDKANKNACPDLTAPATKWLPRSDCPRHTEAYCHAFKGGDPASGTAVEDACLQANSDKCQCDDHPGCKYPGVVDLEIDPRTGYAYAATTTGLLFSPDGGRTWTRTGTEPQPALQPNPAFPPMPNPQMQVKAPKLLTGVDMSGDCGYGLSRYISPVAECGNLVIPDDGYDLQHLPWLIERLGHMSLHFKETGATWPSGRPKGELFMYLPVTWWAKQGPSYVRRSSVFVARAGADVTDPTAPLIFRDVNTTVEVVYSPGCSLRCVEAENASSLPMPKLPRTLQYDSYACYDAEFSLTRCQIRVNAVAGAPSAPGIAYALLEADPIDGSDACTGKSAAQAECNWMTGVY